MHNMVQQDCRINPKIARAKIIFPAL
jgi:hypothetical protein